MRTLHLIEPWWPGAVNVPGGPSDVAVVCCAMSCEPRDAVCVLGPTFARERCMTLGLRPDVSILPVRPVLGLGRNRASPLRTLPQDLGGFDRVAAWTAGALGMARRQGLTPVDLSSIDDAPALTLDWARGGGVLPRAKARFALGIPEDATVVGLLCDPPSLGDATEFVYFTALVERAGVTVVSVVPRETLRFSRARLFARALYLAGGFVATNAALLPLMRAFDAVVCEPVARHTTGRTALAALAGFCGVPVVCAHQDRIAELPGVHASKDLTRASLAATLLSLLRKTPVPTHAS